MVPWWLVAVLVFGTNFILWGGVGLLRATATSCAAAYRRTRRWSRRRHLFLTRRPVRGFGCFPTDTELAGGSPAAEAPFGTDRVAVLMAAHNEELVITESLESVTELVPPGNVHVVSDGSTDRTVELAERAGVNVISTWSNVGKAGALRQAIERFRLVERYPAVLLLDADTRLDRNYFRAALPLFTDPGIVAVAGFVRTDWDRQGMSWLGKLLVCHRQRIYALGQYLLKFGQTWPKCNATHIVPGFASMYRTSVLPHIEMNPPGLVIEDFNMTFEVYQKRLGKVGFTPAAVAVTQDPDNLRDYVRQTRRWALGWWQTVRRHRPRANLFTCMVSLLLLELLTSSLLMVALPLVLVVLLLPLLVPATAELLVLGPLHEALSTYVSLFSLLFGVVAVDLLLTLLVAVAQRRARFLAFGAFFLALRFLDAALSLYTLPMAWLTRSTGRWRSPGRRARGAEPVESAPSTEPDATTSGGSGG
ncbi:Glycosyltransferase, catalytic subunit of cellulose synthase and poly-beta-1,6-N-acetylglucosamine synthase [Actinopolyspora xinjiangensis]|uniref:Glycosyltransferase, catalytic subunit of cellulose synthase and poly-beta-1,6-N-acetylglucosamine synthase n=1 Tax=Actinopolyspora xinjiangensis TaxID=405564 RepID=A0A1H0WUN4_9ACTN|nr:Glycosyltransferase, catalytic subunit of cellulose synthase and poly-beta-1,6-N-acetylglucosamine synthase [Actinopolyspora xinjiangensis]